MPPALLKKVKKTKDEGDKNEQILGKRKHSEDSDPSRQQFLLANEAEIKTLDKDIHKLEKRLGIKSNDAKKRKKLNKTIGQEGYGTGFLDFLDDIENKIKMNAKQYEPKEYEFSDGEGIEEGDLIGNGDSGSD